MKHLKLYRWVAVLTLAIAVSPGTTSAQEADTLSISGTFHSFGGLASINGFEYPGKIGADLAGVYANSDENAWMLTLHDVSYYHDYYYVDWIDGGLYGYDEHYITGVDATSFDFQFFGPDADVLNEGVSQQLVSGSLTDDALLELRNGDGYDARDPTGGGLYSSWDLGLSPLDASVGVTFNCIGDWMYGEFATDSSGYPALNPQRVGAQRTVIGDFRPGNSGTLESLGDLVDVGSSDPPVLPRPPPPTLSIADGSVREGNKGTTRLDLTVTLSRSIKDVVTVNYATANGTALAKSDYTATSGILTFQPGQTSRTIAISIITDRKREKNETFSVKLSGAVSATIDDAVATATILNDD